MNQYLGKKDYEANKDAYDRSLAKLQYQKGCVLPSQTKYHVDNLKFNRCIGNFYSQSGAMLIDFYYKYKEGVMPYEGALMDQPAKIIDVFNIIDGLIKNKTEDLRKKEASKLKGKRNGRG